MTTILTHKNKSIFNFVLIGAGDLRWVVCEESGDHSW